MKLEVKSYFWPKEVNREGWREVVRLGEDRMHWPPSRDGLAVLPGSATLTARAASALVIGWAGGVHT